MSMYIRLKRHQTTIFMHVEASDTFSTVKSKASTILKTDPQNIGLFATADKSRELTDLATIGDQEIRNDQVVFLCIRKGGDTYEDVQVPGEEEGKEPGFVPA